MARLEDVVAFLRDPGAYAPRPPSVEVRETAISVVFMAGDRVLKAKKPVTLPFLDYGEPARRRAFCHEEVRLNRRLAPDAYLGVRAIVDGRHVRAVGRRLAAFHADAHAPADPSGPAAVKRPSDENFQALLDLELERRRLAAAERVFDAFLASRRGLLAVRAAGGRVREGHGDLRLEHVLLLDARRTPRASRTSRRRWWIASWPSGSRWTRSQVAIT